MPLRFLPYPLTLLCSLFLLCAQASETPLLSPLPPDPDRKGAFDQAQADARWEMLSLTYFGERSIIEGEQHVVSIDVPQRTEDDAFVPVSIETHPAAAPASIAKVYLIVDINPIPVAGVFSMTRQRPLENIATRVRVNGYSYVRAIVETSDGELYMAKQLVKSRGVACAAPPITSPGEAAQNLGKMRFRLLRPRQPDETSAVQLMINHPNATGMQKDQVSLLYIPEHYVKEIEVTFNEELLMHAETTYSISENPSFRFSFDPQEQGTLKARMLDTKGNVFFLTSEIEPH
jgi:sulfur-oxidizing protein SoxY